MEPLSCDNCKRELLPEENFCVDCGASRAELLRRARRAAEPAPDEVPTGRLTEEDLPVSAPVPAPAAAAPRGVTGLAFPWGAQTIPPRESLVVGREHPPLVAELSAYPGVGRGHARFDHREEGLFVTDLGSTNGTTVDGRAISEGVPEPLRPGQVVGFGLTLKATVL